VQTPLPGNQRPHFSVHSQLGHTFDFDHETFRVVETGQGTCVALRGAFGERLAVGDVFAYANAQGDQGRLLSCEEDSETGFFLGAWHDPFDVERAG
jgi:hypothetical protein